MNLLQLVLVGPWVCENAPREPGEQYCIGFEAPLVM